MDLSLNQSDELNRRAFISRSAKTFLGVGLMGTSAHALADVQAELVRKPTARNVIYLYMAGGMSHLDTFDPKPGKEEQGPVETIKTRADGIRVSEYFPQTAKCMDKITLVRSLNSTQGAHEQGNYFMHASYVKRGTIRHPGLGAWLVKHQGRTNQTLPGNIRIGGGSSDIGAGFLESKFSPLVIGNPNDGLKNSKRMAGISETEFEKRMSGLEAFDQAFHKRYDLKKVRAYTDMYRDAIKLMKSEDLAAFDIDDEPKSIREAYGENPFGQGCLLARRLVENNVRFVEVVLGGWDTHQGNFINVPDRAGILDNALGALIPDLTRRGMLEETMVVVATEFGRTPSINSNEGRDHYPKAFSCLLAGGGVKGGFTYGKTDEIGANIVEDKISVPDFNASIAYALGLPLDEVVFSPSKRPFTIAHKGKPVLELFG